MSGDSDEAEKYFKDMLGDNYEKVNEEANEARRKEISEFKNKYPYADMSRFNFEVNISKDGSVEGVDIFFKLDDGVTSYDITSDTFKNNREWVRYLTATKPKAWPKIWKSGGTVPAFTNLREPKHEWGIHHYPVFQKAVNLGYPLHNFKVYVSHTDYFYSKFDPIKLYDWKNKAVLYENNRRTDKLPSDVESDIRNVSMDYENEPYFSQICSAYIATFLCGISLDNLKWDDNTPKQITSIVRYHLYYTMKKFIKNPSLMKAYDIRGMKGHLPVSIQSFNGASHGGGTYVKAGWVNYSNSDHMHFIPYKSNGITEIGVELLMDSVESYVYSVLGAQAKTRWSIVSSQLGKSLQTQQAFRRIVNDTVVQTNVNVTIINMRTAIRDTNVILNMAINPNIILIPSRLIILETPIPGYNNILSSPTETTTFGINTRLNYVGVNKKEHPKKHSEESTPVHHLNTLDSDDTTQTVKHTDPSDRPLSHPNIQRTSHLPNNETPSSVRPGSQIDVTTITIVSGLVSFITLKYIL